MTIRIVELAGGLRATLVHQPQATRAAALARVSAGSHHEPPRFAGLAHLLEHLLFRGSQRYQGDDRLMAWVQRQGGNVNATTLARHSAFSSTLPPITCPTASRDCGICCRRRCFPGRTSSAKWRSLMRKTGLSSSMMPPGAKPRRATRWNNRRFFAVFRWVAMILWGKTRDRCTPRCATFIAAIMWPDTCNCGYRDRKRWMR